MATILVIGALDTKGAEIDFVRDQIVQRGHEPFVIDVGVMGEPPIAAQLTRQQVAAAAGHDVAKLASDGDRGRAVTAMADAAREAVLRLAGERRIDGVIALGGGAGTTIGTAVMRALPLGVPKVMVSTLA